MLRGKSTYGASAQNKIFWRTSSGKLENVGSGVRRTFLPSVAAAMVVELPMKREARTRFDGMSCCWRERFDADEELQWVLGSCY